MGRGNSAVLTTKKVESLKPGERVHSIFDSKVPGFCIRTTPKGVKTWSLYYRYNGKQRTMTLGRYPAIGVADARDMAAEAYLKTRKGEDPQATRKQIAHVEAEAQANTFAAVVGQYVEDRDELRTIKTIRRMLGKYCKSWNNIPIKRIERADVIKLRDHVKKHHGGTQSNYLLSTVRALFNWAIDKDLIKESPCLGVKRASASTRRDRTLTPDELRAIWDAAPKLGYPYGPALRELIVTLQRKGEIESMKWSSLDLKGEEKLWQLTADETKAKRAHEVPLTPLAVEVLQDALHVDDEFVFTGRTGKPINSWSTPKRIVDAIIEFDDWVLHDIRRTGADVMRQRLEVPEEIVAGVLNHAPKGVTSQHYAPTVSPKKKREALEAWANWLEVKVLRCEPIMERRHDAAESLIECVSPQTVVYRRRDERESLVPLGEN